MLYTHSSIIRMNLKYKDEHLKIFFIIKHLLNYQIFFDKI